MSNRKRRSTLVAAELDDRIANIVGEVRSDAEVPQPKQIYCNRNLKMADIEYVGFDMDYTLAQYHQTSLENLSIKLTLEKLVSNLGYPKDILELEYEPQRAIRGVVIDKKLGNVCKMDRHGHVGRVFHGFRRLTKSERHAQYRKAKINLSHERYAWIDTLFGLPEAVMYRSIIDFFERKNKHVDFAKLYDDIRFSIDQAHADQSLKSVIKANLGKFIQADGELAEMLHKFRSTGKKTFVLTNSYFLYTDAVMSYLLEGQKKNYKCWRDYFDWIIVGGKKPGFFTGESPFLVVDEESGEGKEPETTELKQGVVYQGGNIRDFERMTGAVGERVLYIGDHIYGDILKLKRSHVWRTAMVIQELEEEYETGRKVQGDHHDLEILDRRRRNLESELGYQEMTLLRVRKVMEENSQNVEYLAQLNDVAEECEKSIEQIRSRVALMQEEVAQLEQKVDRSYNRDWGSMIFEGRTTSRFGEQVRDYADLYTSSCSNFVWYSPLRYFRAARNKMPHEP